MIESLTILQQERLKVLLIGDSCIDEYQYGNVNRISPEAPVPVFSFLYKEEKPGMAENVKNNLETLGCDVTLLSCSNSRKVRLIDKRTGHHIARIDYDDFVKEPIKVPLEILNGYDAVVITDYDKGTVSYDTVKEIRQAYTGPVYIDSKKKDLGQFSGCFVKVNEKERNECTSVTEDLIVTMGSKGAIYKDTLYPARQIDVNDVCGAGDTFLASLVYFHYNLGDIREAIIMANRASAITVQHIGTYAPTLEEIYET